MESILADRLAKATIIAGKGLTTANILYHMPDHPNLLQRFVWQFNDVAPNYPRLRKFLDYWEREIEARIHSIEIAHRARSVPREIRRSPYYGILN